MQPYKKKKGAKTTTTVTQEEKSEDSSSEDDVPKPKTRRKLPVNKPITEDDSSQEKSNSDTENEDSDSGRFTTGVPLIPMKKGRRRRWSVFSQEHFVSMQGLEIIFARFGNNLRKFPFQYLQESRFWLSKT